MSRQKKVKKTKRVQKDDDGSETKSDRRSQGGGTKKAREVSEKAGELLKRIDELLRLQQRESRGQQIRPHIHLCDGTKVDFRKLMR